MILFSAQYWSNSGVVWLLWLSRMSKLISRPAVVADSITQSAGRSRYQLAWCSLPKRITKGGIDQPDALIHSVVVTQSRLPG